MSNNEFIFKKNPFNIIWDSRKYLLWFGSWVIWVILVVGLLVLQFVGKNIGVQLDLSRVSSWGLTKTSVAVLAFHITLLTFGKYIYSKEYFAKMVGENPDVYYAYLADYLFGGVIWTTVAAVCGLKTVLKVDGLSAQSLGFLRIAVMSIVLLGVIQLGSLVIANINRITIKARVESLQK